MPSRTGHSSRELLLCLDSPRRYLCPAAFRWLRILPVIRSTANQFVLDFNAGKKGAGEKADSLSDVALKMTQNSGVGGPSEQEAHLSFTHGMHVIPRCWYIGHSVPGSGRRRKQKEQARAAVAARGKDSIRGLPCG